MIERYGYSWLVWPTFRPFALVILASTCRCELFRSRYGSFTPFTVNLIGIPGWIHASGAYSQLNSVSITGCFMIEPNRSTSLVISSVTSPPMMAILKIINNWLSVRWILNTFFHLFIYMCATTLSIWPRLDNLRHYDRWIGRRCGGMIISHLNLIWGDLVDRGAKDRSNRGFERRHDYIFDRGIFINCFAAGFKKSLGALYCNRF